MAEIKVAVQVTSVPYVVLTATILAAFVETKFRLNN